MRKKHKFDGFYGSETFLFSASVAERTHQKFKILSTYAICRVITILNKQKQNNHDPATNKLFTFLEPILEEIL